MLISVTRCGNESDIIEAFVCHHSRLFDLMLVIDDDSTDGTADILSKMRAEGMPLVLFQAREVDWAQEQFVNILMHLAAEKFDASWIFPLDVDEFVEIAGGRNTLCRVLDVLDDNVLELRWSNFAWFASEAADQAINPVIRMRQRCFPRADNSKVAVPASLVKGNPNAKLSSGNHRLHVGGAALRVIHHKSLALCHYPIRSIEQVTSKIVINKLRYLSRPGRDPRLGVQYNQPFALIGDQPALVAEMQRQSLSYSLPSGRDFQEGYVDAPLDYLGGDLRHSSHALSAMENIARHAEVLAATVAALEAKVATLTTQLGAAQALERVRRQRHR